MEKKDYFNKEYNYVKDTNKRNDLILLVSGLPDYFFEIPASSTGKYHPEFAATEHGLVKHTKVATRIAYELLNNPGLNNFTDSEKDIIIMRYGLDGNDEITQKEIARTLGISRSYVSRIEKRATTKILKEFIKNKHYGN